MRAAKIRGVYAIVCVPTDRVYVGCSEHIYNRWRTHMRLLNAGQHTDPELQQAWRHFGSRAFHWEVLQTCGADEPLLAFENLWMEQYRDRLLNAMPGNRHGLASRRALSEAQKQAWVERYATGRDRLSLAVRSEIARSTRAWAAKPEVRARMRQNAIEGDAARHIRTPEAVAHQAATIRGVPKSAAQRANMSRAHSSGTCKCHPRKESRESRMCPSCKRPILEGEHHRRLEANQRTEGWHYVCDLDAPTTQR